MSRFDVDYTALALDKLADAATEDNPLWDDLRVSLSRATTGSNNPTMSTFVGNTQAYAFSPTTMNQLFFDVQLPHTWDGGTGIRPHVHWSPGNSTNTGVVRWGLEYTWANAVAPPGNVWPATATIYAEQAATGTPYSHQIAEFGEIAGTGFRLSSILMCRIFRDAAAPADTFTGSAFAVSCDIHHLNVSGGSVQEYPGAPS